MTLMDNSVVKILLYADDTILFFSHKDPLICSKSVENALSLVTEWCSLNKLTINVSKTKHMLCRPRNCTPPFAPVTVQMGNITLDNVLSYNYLGVIIDNQLCFEQFLKSKCSKINLCLYQLGKMRKYITADIANVIYKQAILPHFDYADFLVDSGPAYYINRLKSLHEKGLKIIDCKANPGAESVELQTCYRVKSPSFRQKEHHLIIMYRLSKFGFNLENYRPKVHLRSRKKVKFKHQKRNLER